jgi:acetyl xylan esterase AXE1
MINPLPLRPSSGTGPWDLSALQQTIAVQVGASHQVQEGDRTLTLTELYYAGEPWLGQPTQVFAYYARPSQQSPQPLPAMVLIHGGGGTASPEWTRQWAYRGYAALAMDLYGRGPDGARLTSGGADWSDLDIAFRLTAGIQNGWIYQAVANIIRGISALGSLPEVDTSRVGVTGVSWGGILTCFAMSLDPRLSLAAPVYGFGFNPMLGIPPNPSEAECDLVRAHFEPGLYLSRCAIPVLWMTGTSELTLERFQQSYRAARGPRTLSVTVRPSHNDPQLADMGWERPEVYLFADAIFRGTAGLATITRMDIRGYEVHVGYESSVPLQNAAIHWTTDVEREGSGCQWHSAFAARVSDGQVRAELPQDRPVLAFLTLMDRRGAVISTEHMYLA